MAENHSNFEMHGCIVCGKVYDVLVLYTPEGKMVDCKVTSPGGHRLPENERPLVACNTHKEEEIAKDYIRWRSRMGKETDKEQADE